MTIKCIQWNARSLSKSKLSEFKNFLFRFTPDIVFLSETHWREGINVKFQSYSLVRKNCLNHRGGGVAILIHDFIQTLPLNLKSLDTLEAVGISIISPELGTIDLISVYCPRGNCSSNDFWYLLNRRHQFFIGGDFNSHHPYWDTNINQSASGVTIFDIMNDSPDLCLLTPPNFGTRIDPSSGARSTIDLSFTSCRMSLNFTIKLGEYLNSDHLPIHIDLNTSPIRSSRRPPSWIFYSEKWPLWNSTISLTLDNTFFHDILSPEVAYHSFHSAIRDVSKKFF